MKIKFAILTICLTLSPTFHFCLRKKISVQPNEVNSFKSGERGIIQKPFKWIENVDDVVAVVTFYLKNGYINSVRINSSLLVLHELFASSTALS